MYRDWMVLDNELEIMCEEAVVVRMAAVSPCLPGRT